jgi:hypothetical protein
VATCGKWCGRPRSREELGKTVEHAWIFGAPPLPPSVWTLVTLADQRTRRSRKMPNAAAIAANDQNQIRA